LKSKCVVVVCFGFYFRILTTPASAPFIPLYWYRFKENVAKDAELYGMCLLGDGATVKGMPLMNVLVTTPNSCNVLDIIDCTEHMEVGGKKDARYIAEMFEEHIEALDPKGIHLNAILFDGASNVQKAGRVIEARYPQVSILHGIEHVVSLFFADVAKLPFVSYVICNYRRIYRVFGSGAMHAPYAIFQKQSITFNGGKKIGLIRAADTRMAGYFIAFHRMLRLKPALEATVASVEFQGLNLTKSVVVKAVAILKDKEFWRALHILTRSLFPALRVLRLADKSEPGFDCLYYFIRRADKALEWSTRSFNTVPYFTSALSDPAAQEDQLFHNGLDDEADEDDDDFQSMLADGYDESDREGDSDEDSTPRLPYATTGRDLGRNIVNIWKKRKQNMVSDFCIAGWLLSPLEEVMVDVKACKTGDNNEAMDRILGKMYYRLTEEELGTLKDTFWTEWDEFSTKTGRFGHGRKYIWNSDLIRKRKSAKWHSQYSVSHTEVSLLLFLFLLSSTNLTFPVVVIESCYRYLARWPAGFYRLYLESGLRNDHGVL
jgi:Protein of unknown function (DUF 659)